MKDSILEMIVKLSESDSPLETGITLIVDGFLISGYIVSKDNYMRHYPLTSTIEDALQEAFSKQSQEEEESQPNERNFIHLRDAKYFSPGQNPIPGDGTIYCRIPLEKVSGFNFGVLSASTQS